jgi:hypothetical protein
MVVSDVDMRSAILRMLLSAVNSRAGMLRGGGMRMRS